MFFVGCFWRVFRSAFLWGSCGFGAFFLRVLGLPDLELTPNRPDMVVV